MNIIPQVTEKIGDKEIRSSDIFSSLLKDRIIFIGDKITDLTANSVVAQLLFLEAEDSEKDICIYINSPGGSISAGMAIYDTIQFIRPDVSTICIGMAASMGAFLLSSGTKGKRFALPNSEIMIHQPLGSFQGQADDIRIQAAHMEAVKAKYNRLLAQNCGKSVKSIDKACERDYFMSPSDAKEFGIIDDIITRREI